MARRKKDSLVEILLDLAVSVSWKVSIPIAILSYIGFHYVAGLPLTPATDLNSLNDSIYRTFFVSFSKVFQYLIPLIFIVGAGVSILKNKQRSKLLDSQSSLDTIRSMSWQEFELLVAEAFKRKGFEVKENGGGGADGGIDLILTKNGKKSIVQCKRWKAFSVGVPLIRELFGVMTAERANDCIFVSSGNYTAEARLFAEGKPIWLIDGSELLNLVSSVQVQPSISNPELTTEYQPANPTCPLCGSNMVRRVAKKGAKAGSQFWGCSKFPGCKGTI